MNKNEIAVIGMAFRFGDASDENELHALLTDKRECVSEISQRRKELLGLSSEKEYIPMSCIDDAEYFDNVFFGISADRAAYIDPQQKLALTLVLEAIENAGYSHEELKGSNTSVQLAASEDHFGICCGDKAGTSFTNSNAAMTAGIISHFFDFRGPAAVINSACTSSLYAVNQACLQLTALDTDLAVAGGIDLNLIIPELDSIDRGLYDIASSDGHTRSFSADADGCGLGDGAGIVLLKRLKDAVRDNDNIYAVICASSSNSCGGASPVPGMPNAAAQSEIIIKNISTAEIQAEKIRFAECHASATPIGDSIEAKALSEALKAFTEKKQFCAVTSLKSNFGHMNMASGIAGLIKAVISLHKSTIYPLANFKSPNPLIDFENGAVYPAIVTEKLVPTEDNYASVMAYGHSGANTNVILRNHRDSRSIHEEDILLPFVLNAQSSDAFNKKCRKLLEYLKRENVPLRDISFTLCKKINHNGYIRGFSAGNKNELIKQLEALESSECTPVMQKEKIIFIAADDSTVSDTLKKELGCMNCENISAQLEFGKFLLSCGINPDTIWGCKGSNSAVAVLSGQAHEEELPILYAKYSAAEFNSESFTKAVSAVDVNKCCFICLGSKNKMTDIIYKVLGSRAAICCGESLAEYISFLFNCGIIADASRFFGNIDVRRAPLSLCTHEKTISWPRNFIQPDLSGFLGGKREKD